jgi:hypothetical protein
VSASVKPIGGWSASKLASLAAITPASAATTSETSR